MMLVSALFGLVLLFISIPHAVTPLGNPLRPSSVTQADGLPAQFLCEHPTGTIDWTLNGTYLRNIDTSGGLISRKGRGSATEALVIRALPRYNETEVVCTIFYMKEDGTVTVEFSAPAKLIVQGQLGNVRDLRTNSTSSTIQLSWKPPFSLNLTAVDPDIAYCVDIYKVNDRDMSKAHIVSYCNVLVPRYTFSSVDPDPKDVFSFTVTPRNNVEGARNGNSSIINGTYSYERPGAISSTDAEVVVEVDAAEKIMAKIHLQNSYAIPRRPDKYEVSIISIADNSISYVCPVDIYQDAGNITLILNCSDIIQPKQLYKVNITGANPAGNTTIIQDIPLSTHYVQDINTTSSTQTPGQVDISCEFLVNSTRTLGYVALVYSDKDVHYLVTKNRDQGIVTNHLQGLGGKSYSTLLYAINESGLPLNQAAGFPTITNVSITGNLQAQERTSQGTHDGGVSANISQCYVNSQQCLIECAFSENSTATACIVVYWIDKSYSYGLVSLNTSKLDRNQGVARRIIEMEKLEGESRGYHVAIFAYSNNIISGEPLIKVYVGTGAGTPKQQQTALIAAVVSILIILMAVIAIISVNFVSIRVAKGKRSTTSDEGERFSSMTKV